MPHPQTCQISAQDFTESLYIRTKAPCPTLIHMCEPKAESSISLNSKAMIKNMISSDLSEEVLKVIELFITNLRPAQLEHLNMLVRKYPLLVTGSFYLRSTSKDGSDFALPGPATSGGLSGPSVIAWSRIQNDQEFLCAFNLSSTEPAIIYATVDNQLHLVNGRMQCMYASSPSPAELNVEVRNGKAIRVTIPAHGLVIYS